MADEQPGPVDLVHRAMQELGEAAADAEVAALIGERYGVRIQPRFVPILKASVREREVIEQARRAARELAQRLQAEQAADPKKKPRGKRAKQDAGQDDQAPTPKGGAAGQAAADGAGDSPEIRGNTDSGGGQPAA